MHSQNTSRHRFLLHTNRAARGRDWGNVNVSCKQQVPNSGLLTDDPTSLSTNQCRAWQRTHEENADLTIRDGRDQRTRSGRLYVLHGNIFESNVFDFTVREQGYIKPACTGTAPRANVII
jgi:hypothetical protein